MRSYYIVCLKHTKPKDKYLTLWRPDDAGYCWSLGVSGEYTEETVENALTYYDDGKSNIAVLKGIVEALAVECEPYDLVLLNTARVRKMLRAARVSGGCT